MRDPARLFLSRVTENREIGTDDFNPGILSAARMARRTEKQQTETYANPTVPFHGYFLGWAVRGAGREILYIQSQVSTQGTPRKAG